MSASPGTAAVQLLEYLVKKQFVCSDVLGTPQRDREGFGREN